MKRLLCAHGLIHIFALLHVAVIYGFSFLSYADSVPLTVLTLSLLLLVGRLYRFPWAASAVVALLFCFAAFFLGTQGATFLSPYFSAWGEVFPNMLCSFFVTELLGWSMWFVASHTPQHPEA